MTAMDRFEKILITLIATLGFFVILAQYNLYKEHKERKLRQRYLYHQFLAQEEIFNIEKCADRIKKYANGKK
jgi:hypothetical protein